MDLRSIPQTYPHLKCKEQASRAMHARYCDVQGPKLFGGRKCEDGPQSGARRALWTLAWFSRFQLQNCGQTSLQTSELAPAPPNPFFERVTEEISQGCLKICKITLPWFTIQRPCSPLKQPSNKILQASERQKNRFSALGEGLIQPKTKSLKFTLGTWPTDLKLPPSNETWQWENPLQMEALVGKSSIHQGFSKSRLITGG